jgi:hypothetical protein
VRREVVESLAQPTRDGKRRGHISRYTCACNAPFDSTVNFIPFLSTRQNASCNEGYPSISGLLLVSDCDVDTFAESSRFFT